MAIDVVARGRRGRIYVRDERDDGAVVLLVCEEADERLDAEPTGILVPPSAPAPAVPDPHKGSYPLGLRDDRLLELSLDTTGLERGLHRFRMQRFADHAVELAEDGARAVAVDNESARNFGLVERPLDATA